MNDTKWIYKENHVDEDLLDLNIDKDILNILYNRNIRKKKDIQSFLSDNIENLIDPFDFAHMEKAVNRILSAIDKRENIWIYGDYDVDGITSTSICYLALKDIGAKVNYYIPLRDEGYGLNTEALDFIKEKEGNVIISVDCGISSLAEAKHAKEINLDLIITDHHEITTELPDAYAILNPKREDQSYSFKYLAGVGTAFMLLLGIFTKLNKKKELYKYLDIVAIGTIADIVPLVNQNRILVKSGLNLLPKTENIGLKTLLPLIFEKYHEKEYNSYDIGFVIAPIFNAAGRLEDAKMAVELLTTPSQTTARVLSEKLINQNNERKDIQASILEMVEDDISERKLSEKAVIVSSNKNYHHGVIGIVASKIVDKYYKPVIIIEKKDEIGVASCRSIENFNILEGLNSMADIFIKYGGHAGAAGFSIPLDKIDEFEKRINQYANGVLAEEDYLKPIKIDKDILFNKISYEFYQKLDKLKPFGFGNTNPTFALKSANITNIRLIGKEKNHLMLDINEGNLTIKNCVWFGNGHNFEELQKLNSVDIAFKLKQEIYKDKYYTKVFIEDIQSAKEKINPNRLFFDLYDTAFPIETIVYSRTPIELDDNIELIITEESAYIKKSNKVIGFLDNNLREKLFILKFEYNFDFRVDVKKIVKTSNNYHVYINLERKFEFFTLSFKNSDIFKDIKNYLLGSFPYNSFQKEALAGFIKEKKNLIIKNGKDRGLKTLLLTFALFYKIKEKKVLFITNEKIQSNIMHENFEISNIYRESYDLYIYWHIIPEKLNNRAIIVTNENIFLDGYYEVDGSIQIPNNFEIISDLELEKHKENYIYTRKLPKSRRVEVYKNLHKYKKIVGNKDLLKLI